MSEAPTPFTAEQIRLGCPPGRQVTTRMVGEAGEEVLWRTTFLECDDEGASIEYQQVSRDGQPAGEASRGRSTWEDLRMHAAFPEPSVTISEEMIQTPLGDLLTTRYQVSEGDRVRILWFADSLPGMPVRTAALIDGEERLDSEIVADTSVA